MATNTARPFVLRCVFYCLIFLVIWKFTHYHLRHKKPSICEVYDRTSAFAAVSYQPYPNKVVVNDLLEYTASTNFCPEEDDGVLVIVDSSRNNSRDRNLIRNTWGSTKSYKGFWVRVVFLVGQSSFCFASNNSSLPGNSYQIEHDNLLKEQLLFKDVVIGEFTDTYRNLTYKHLVGYKFFLENCQRAKFIVKTDDDMFVNIPKIISTIARGEPAEDLYCHFYHDQPTRDQDGKWFSTREEWPEDTYPLYCLGNGYFMTAEWVRNIYSVRNLGGFFWVDDVFIMGKLREIAEHQVNQNVKMLDIGGNNTDSRGNPDELINNCARVDFGYFVYLSRDWQFFETLMECLWRKSVLES